MALRKNDENYGIFPRLAYTAFFCLMVKRALNALRMFRGLNSGPVGARSAKLRALGSEHTRRALVAFGTPIGKPLEA